MTPLRIRPYGATEWTLVFVDGEWEDEVVAATALRWYDAGFHVQVMWADTVEAWVEPAASGPWEDYDGV